MRVNITIRDLPNGEVDVKVKSHGGKRPGGAGAESLANSIIKAIAMTKRAQQSLKDMPPETRMKVMMPLTPPVAEASH